MSACPVRDRFGAMDDRVRGLVRVAAHYWLDINQQVAGVLFESAQWAGGLLRSTPIYPVIELQQTFARKAVEHVLSEARARVARI